MVKFIYGVEKMINVERLELRIGYTFKNKKLADMAITHKSYAHDMKNESPDAFNERIEFLGDAILEYIVSRKLYERLPEAREGVLTKKRARIVCEKSLCSVIKEVKLDSCLKLGKCELKVKNSKKDAMLADMFEAILGAIYLDAGFEKAEEICFKLLGSRIEDEINNVAENEDYKTRLQEEIQKSKDKSIKYELVKEEGPAHDKVFYVEVYINDKKTGEGNGKSKKEAEQKAAKEALQNIQN